MCSDYRGEFTESRDSGQRLRNLAKFFRLTKVKTYQQIQLAYPRFELDVSLLWVLNKDPYQSSFALD
jgi:hypothetical protein